MTFNHHWFSIGSLISTAQIIRTQGSNQPPLNQLTSAQEASWLLLQSKAGEGDFSHTLTCQYSCWYLRQPITVTTQSASTLACDIVITAALAYTLRGSKSDIKGLFIPSIRSLKCVELFNNRTNTMLSALIVNAVNRGMLTAVSALINMTLVTEF
jgi:hypothetical protein